MWNFGDMFDAVAKVVPGDRPALVFGDQVTVWRDFDGDLPHIFDAAGVDTGGAHAGGLAFTAIDGTHRWLQSDVAAITGRTKHGCASSC